MRVLIVLAVVLFLTNNTTFAFQLNGSIERQELINKSKIIDKETGLSVPNAKITVPSSSFSTLSDSDGSFKLPKGIKAPYVVTVKKDGYSPFSLTIDETGAALTIEIEKNSMNKLVIESDTFHLGDGQFSDNSANADDFKLTPTGSIYEKSFTLGALNNAQRVYIAIGSIIGIDTLDAKNLGQTGVKYAYSSAPRIFFNNKEIGKIKLNGDNQKILVPKNIVKPNNNNNVTIVAGKNLFQHEYTDYDDFEFTHLFLEMQ